MEIWKTIEGINRSFSSIGRVRNDKTGAVFYGSSLRSGYRVLHIDGKNQYVHRLIGKCFLWKFEYSKRFQ